MIKDLLLLSFLHALLLFQLLDTMLKSDNPSRFKHETLGEILGQHTVHYMLDLMQLQGHHNVQLIQLLPASPTFQGEIEVRGQTQVNVKQR